MKLKDVIVESDTIKTLKGSIIKRYKNLVGKSISTKVYVHRKYAMKVIPQEVLEHALESLDAADTIKNFEFNTVVWDMKTGVVRFDEAPDFDTAREPHVGKYVVVSPDGSIKQGSSNSIWHHKWLWVMDDYKGFDVEQSKEWSKLWLSKIPEVAKGTDAGWEAQLKKYGLKGDN